MWHEQRISTSWVLASRCWDNTAEEEAEGPEGRGEGAGKGEGQGEAEGTGGNIRKEVAEAEERMSEAEAEEVSEGEAEECSGMGEGRRENGENIVLRHDHALNIAAEDVDVRGEGRMRGALL